MASINWYPGHMAKTKRLISENLGFIDVVYEVIDARIPLSSKMPDLEEYIKTKPRIIILTKYDLCDKVETKKFIKYYENKGFTVLPFDLEHALSMQPLISKTKELMKTLNDKRETKGLKIRKTRVLIVGVPNVGKSTLINRLVGRKATNVGNMPGVTRSLSWIRINESLELLDTPGILWPKIESDITAFNLATFTAIKEEVLPTSEVVKYILDTLYKLYPNILLDRYGITSIDPEINNTLDIIGKKRGCLIKGGLVDYDKVELIIINDIKQGIVKGITFDRI